MPVLATPRGRLLLTSLGGARGPPNFANAVNISATAFPAWRSAKARVAAGTGRGRIAIVGPSTSMGWGAGTGGTAHTGARALILWWLANDYADGILHTGI
jgi:hypothetical protein